MVPDAIVYQIGILGSTQKMHNNSDKIISGCFVK